MGLISEAREALAERPAVRQAIATFAGLCGGLVFVIVFLAIMGAFDPTEAVGLSIAAVVLFLVWAVAAWSRNARADVRRVDWRDRERRGF